MDKWEKIAEVTNIMHELLEDKIMDKKKLFKIDNEITEILSNAKVSNKFFKRLNSKQKD